MLSGGHPNSLGRTLEVVDIVLKNRQRLDELFDCYGSGDAVVRLRVSNALKRIEAEKHDWVVPYIDRLIGGVGNLDQASAQWTLVQLFQKLARDMTERQLFEQAEGNRDAGGMTHVPVPFATVSSPIFVCSALTFASSIEGSLADEPRSKSSGPPSKSAFFH